jgi:hypothetical protein
MDSMSLRPKVSNEVNLGSCRFSIAPTSHETKYNILKIATSLKKYVHNIKYKALQSVQVLSETFLKLPRFILVFIKM